MDKLVEKVTAAKGKWVKQSTDIQIKNKQLLLEFNLNPLDIWPQTCLVSDYAGAQPHFWSIKIWGTYKISLITILTLCLHHGKFTWSDFGGTYTAIPLPRHYTPETTETCFVATGPDCIERVFQLIRNEPTLTLNSSSGY